MAIESKRGCGYRKVGGLYLCSGGEGYACDRLPFELIVCPTCNHGIKQSRGWTWVDVNALLGGIHPNCQDNFPCPVCMATPEMGKAGLLWVGERFYPTTYDFNREAGLLGISKRIHAVPREFELGKTWVLLAHPKAVKEGKFDPETGASTPSESPGIFKVWRPNRIEKIVQESKRGSEEVARLEKKGITPVFVPDDDPDHASNQTTNVTRETEGNSNDYRQATTTPSA